MSGEYGRPKSHLREDVRNPWFLGVVGLVAAALIGTIWMSVLAFSSSPQLVVENYYETGKNYFHKRPDDPATAWRMNLMPPAGAKVTVSQSYYLYAISHDGEPLAGGKAKLFAYRPDDGSADFSVPMRQLDPGQFVAEVAFPLPGTWDLIGQVEANGESHDVSLRVFIAE